MQGIIKELRSHTTPRTYRKGAPIYFQGEVPRAVTIILNGVVRAYSITSSGEERTIALYTTKDILPLAWALGDAPTSFLHYEAFSEVRVLEINKPTLLDILETNIALSRSLIQQTGNNYASLLLRVAGLSQSRAIEKIAYTLYYLAFHHGLERPDGFYELNLQLNQSVIASFIGQTRESTARNIKTLKEHGVINYSGATYLVHLKKLEKFIGEDSFRDIASTT